MAVDERRLVGVSASATTATAHDASGTDRMARNAHSLIASSVVTSVLGFAFWVVAARALTPEEVGTGGALVAALVLLANISTLGLRNAFQRFLPTAGTTTRSLIAGGYGIAALAGVGVGAVFIVGSRWWASDLDLLHDSPFASIAFAVSVAVWAVFVLQDSVLIGLRHATWVPIENLVYTVAKLVLLVVVASTGSWALLIAWMVPALLIIGPLNVGIFRRLVPTTNGPGVPFDDRRRVPWRDITRFAAGDHLADTIRFIGADGVVLVVVAQLGAEATAPLVVALTIAASFQLVASNIVSAFVAEAAARPVQAEELLRSAALRIARLVVPAALLGALGAPLALRIFGAEYASDGTAVLQLLLVASIPQIATQLAVGWARYQRRVARVVAISIGAAVWPLFGAVVLAPDSGIVAVGWTALVGQLVLASILLAGMLRFLLPEPLRRRVVTVAVSLRNRIRRGRRVRAAATTLDELDATRFDRPPLHPRSIVTTENDVIVARVADAEQPLVVKITLNESAAEGIDRHARSILAMYRATAGSTARSLLPRVVETGEVMGQSYVIETACPGEHVRHADDVHLASAAAAMSALHRSTARPLADPLEADELVEAVVRRPIAVMLRDPRLAPYADTLGLIGQALTQSLGSTPVQVARTHGDCWLGNILFDTSTAHPFVSGVVDWENSIELGLPEIDLAHLWLSSHRAGMASGVLHALTAGRFVDLTRTCSDGAVNPDLPAATVVTLAWLAHIADGLDRSTRFALGRIWMRRNVTRVLDAFADGKLYRLIADPVDEQRISPRGDRR